MPGDLVEVLREVVHWLQRVLRVKPRDEVVKVLGRTWRDIVADEG